MAQFTGVSREVLTGAIKMVNVLKATPRLDHVRTLLLAEGYEAKTVEKVLTDLDSYPDWAAGAALDAPPANG